MIHLFAGNRKEAIPINKPQDESDTEENDQTDNVILSHFDTANTFEIKQTCVE